MTRIPLSLTQALIATLLLAPAVYAADDQKPATQPTGTPEHISVAFSDPSQPGKLSVKILSASISIKGYAGKEVVIDARMGSGDEGEDKDNSRDRSSGMRRIRNSASGLEVEEEHNVMSVRTGWPNQHPVHLTIQVPVRRQ